MFEHVLFYYQRQGVIRNLSLCLEKLVGDNSLPFNQKLTPSMHQLEQLGENMDAIRKTNLS